MPLCITQKEVKALDLDKDFMTKVRNGLLNLASRGLASKEGREKKVVGAATVEYALKMNMERAMIKNYPVTIQSCLYMLLCLYTGMRPGSIVPPLRMVEKVWAPLVWKVTRAYYCS
jgi:hypothetical protein